MHSVCGHFVCHFGSDLREFAFNPKEYWHMYSMVLSTVCYQLSPAQESIKNREEFDLLLLATFSRATVSEVCQTGHHPIRKPA